MSDQPATSISFDRAADYYDETRRLTDEARDAMTELLSGEIDGRDPTLEIGVGTGLVALPLHRVGAHMVGLDLSRAMVDKLLEKAGGRPPFPIILGSATQLPFADDSFGSAIGRHVLHLIPGWRLAVAELFRVVRPGGVLLLNAGHKDESPWRDIDEHLKEELGDRSRHAGLSPDDVAELDAEVARLGGTFRELPLVWQESDLTIERSLDELSSGIYSWTWAIDPPELERAIANTRVWALDRFGRLDEVLEPRFPHVWRAYDVTG
jgi:SAM-dependent methyltransferase